jgi:hypothetical protein
MGEVGNMRLHNQVPRVQAAIIGKTPDGEPVKGDYKFTDEFPMADGLKENAHFPCVRPRYGSPVRTGEP